MQLLKDLTSFLKTAKKPIVVIMGPTAAGKTAISLKIAHEINGEIISTDSRQLYKGMEIGTDIILPKNQQNIPHHMLAISTPDRTITLGEYKKQTLQIIDEIHKRNAIPMLVGGTGLYISAIIEGYNVPEIPPHPRLRKKLAQEAEEKGPEHLHSKLQKLDSKAAEKIHPNNIRYVIRAIEIHKAKGQIKKTKESGSPFDIFMIGIKRPRKEIYERIGTRVNKQIERGLLKEIKALLNKGYDPTLPAMSSLGVKEIIPYIEGEKPLEECLEILKRNTRRYAKRQMTWFSRYDNVHWVTPEKPEKITKK